jgi:glycosyltransferase involved in cell wall biosynthesis
LLSADNKFERRFMPDSHISRPSILVAATYLTREQAGAAQSLVTIIRELGRAGWADVSVAAYKWDEALLPKSVRLIGLRHVPDFGPLWRLHPLTEYWHAIKALRERGLAAFDLCYTQSITMGLAYRKLYPSVPIASHPGFVLWGREILEESDLPLRWRRFHAGIARRMEARTYRQPGWLHLVSSRLVGDTRSHSFGLPRQLFQVAPLPVDPRRFDPGAVRRDIRQELDIPTDAFVIISVARLVPLKRIDAVVRALSSIDDSAMLVVVGDGPEQGPLEELSRRLGLSTRVRFVGRQDPRDYLAAADVFALPSRLESFGLAYVEAMMMGLTCIGLRYRDPDILSAAVEVLGDGEFGFVVDTDEELCARLRMLANDRDTCRAMGERARRRALEWFTPSGYVSRLHGAVAAMSRT